ncbi:H(+)/Cl(-) exchange transporter ClcA [Photobacterium aphoticum]|uniref:H(+)/Cl(-) exchange transporter ClcA n=1 Tax=Photobacterium aphoticum TaxID=754436 RepID=A0A090QSP3_9GAMM|nr:H(+)/Cl(-) exchange transporter ClcA [Photobacterium aphoticum]
MTDNNQGTPAPERHQPSGLVRRFLSRDKTPLSVLLLSALVGVGAGLLSTLFEIGVHWVAEQRTVWLRNEFTSALPLWLSAFLISAALAVLGYYLVHRFAPEAGGSGIPEIEGAMDGMRPVRWWRVLPVKFIGGLGALVPVWCWAAKDRRCKWAVTSAA